ncbi:MAG: hypothetical protein CUN55_00925 [Phototrophicales bacterium]|nr:MAG: hypothetical protein CUN55_00925 [Phototrophicales bacterium]
MPVRQVYYTSTKHPRTNQVGYQIIAKTPNLSPQEISMLNGLMNYAIPHHLQNEDISTHPIALRYLPINAQKAALVCAQSIGIDENGRLGNYFAHAVIGDMISINRMSESEGWVNPPITHWRNSFWQREYNPEQLELPELPRMPTNKNNQEFFGDRVFEFIGQGQRPKLFRALLSAISRKQNRLIIKDTPENIVLWIYAASIALPPRLRYYLSFTTYTHDPQNADFTLVGVLPEQMLSGALWVLDGVQQTVPEIPSSYWADYIVDHFQHYPEKIHHILGWMDNRLYAATEIPTTLDDLLFFALSKDKGTLGFEPARLLVATQAVTQTIPKPARPEDKDDALKAIDFLIEIIDKEPTEKVIPPLSHLAQAARPETVPKMIEALVIAINKGLRSIARPIHYELVHNLEGQAELAKSENLERLEIKHPANVVLFWELIAPHLDFANTSTSILQSIVDASLQVWDKSSATANEELEKMTREMQKAVRAHAQTLLPLINAYKVENPQTKTFEQCYYEAVRNLSPEQRAESYWHRYWSDNPSLAVFEIQSDLERYRSTQEKIDYFIKWLAAVDEGQRKDILKQVLDTIWEDFDRVRLANRLLADSVTEDYTGDWYQTLLEATLLGSVIDIVDENTRLSYEKFEKNIPVDPRLAAVFEGSLALMRRELGYEVANHIQERYSSLELEYGDIYQYEVERLLSVFFGASHEQHLQLIRAIYHPKWRDLFWELYMGKMRACLLEENDLRTAMQVLDFWFYKATELYTERPFVIPEFFVQLPIWLENIRSERAYKRIEQEFEQQCQERKWFAVIERFLNTKGKRGRLGGLWG